MRETGAERARIAATPCPATPTRPTSSGAAAAPVVSIIVVTHNAPEYVRRCLESVRARTLRPPYELIVIDNASDAPTREYLRSLSGIRLILNGENRLWAAACNQGMRAADPRSRYLLLLNSDIEILRDDWLEVLTALIESGPRVGIVGPHRIRMRYGPVYGHIDGDCFMFRRELLDEIGEFDAERWPWAGANVEFTVAAFARGWIYKVVHPHDRIVLHHGQKSRTPELQARILRLSKPRRQYAEILRRHGIRPRYAPLERLMWLGPLLRLLDRGRFYYAPPSPRPVPSAAAEEAEARRTPPAATPSVSGVVRRGRQEGCDENARNR